MHWAGGMEFWKWGTGVLSAFQTNGAFIPSSTEKLGFFLAEGKTWDVLHFHLQDIADLLSPSSVHESKVNNAEFLGMSWECPLTLMAPRPPHGLCQLWRAVGWQQGTWRSFSDRVMLRGLSWSFGELRWNACVQGKCRALLCSCHRLVFSAFFVASVE